MQDREQPDTELAGDEVRGRRRYRSLFWAVVLIGVGIVWLLANLDVVSSDHLGMLSVLWPILLVGVGVDMVVGRRSPAIGGLVGVITVGLIIVFMLLGPRFGWAGNTELKTQTFNAPVGEATSARVALDLSAYSASIRALQPSTAVDRALLNATITHRGSAEFESTGDLERTVRLAVKGERWWWHWSDLSDVPPWDIGLDPDLPLDLSVESSSGSTDLDLWELHLTALQVDMSSGDMDLLLPAIERQGYEAALELSSGDMRVQVADGARIDMSIDMSSGDVLVALGAGSDVTVTFDGSSGEFTLTLQPGQALRVEVRDVSSGDVDLPAGLTQISQGEDEEGTWETQGYATASHRVLVVIDSMSSGSVTIGQ